jgi:hypothetical protein
MTLLLLEFSRPFWVSGCGWACNSVPLRTAQPLNPGDFVIIDSPACRHRRSRASRTQPPRPVPARHSRWLGPGGVQTGSASPELGCLRGPIREGLCHSLLADLAHILPYK